VARLAGKACPVSSMMALRAHARGGPEQLRYERAPVPVPGPGEVLVTVHAAGITFAEFSWDLSWTTKDGADRTPVIPAHEIHAMFFIVAPDPAALAGLAERASTKSLRPLISSEFPLAEGRQAYESGGQSRPPGKTVLLVR
jgi:hypothetical protein